MAETKKLPINIIANSSETFLRLEKVVNALSLDFINQFKSVEIGFSIKFNADPFQAKERQNAVGTLKYVSQGEPVNVYGSEYQMYTVGCSIEIDGKEVDLTCEFLLSPKTKLSLNTLNKPYA